jgi:hypothetical protein
MTGCVYQFSDWGTLAVELGIGASGLPSNPGIWGSTLWGAINAFWSGQEPQWHDITDRTIGVSIERGRQRWTDRIGASSCSVTVDNADGWITWNSDQLGNIDAAPGRLVRVRLMTPDGITHDLWRGFLEGVADDYTPSARPQAVLVCQDAIAQVAHVDLPERTPEGAGETSDARVNRILDNADWPAAWRTLDAGQVTMQATNLARQLADELGITADSEGGIVYAGTDGNVTFRNRDWLRLASYASTVQQVIGAPGSVCASAYRVVRSGDDIRNDVQIGRAGSTPQRVVNLDSVALYRRRAFSRTDLICESDAQALLIAQRLIGSRATSTVRLAELVVPTVDQASTTFVASVDYGWRLTVNWSDGAGESWTRTVHVMGVRHDITPSGWICNLAVDDAVLAPTQPWGVGLWGTAQWTEVA